MRASGPKGLTSEEGSKRGMIVLHEPIVKDKERVPLSTIEIAAAYRTAAREILGQPDKPQSGISGNSRYGDWCIYLPYWACLQFAEKQSLLAVPRP